MKSFIPWRASLAFSLIIHIALGLFLFLYHPEKKEKTTPFVTRLVSPEELRELDKGRPSGPVRKGPPAPAQPSSPPRAQRPPAARSRSHPSPQARPEKAQPSLPSQGVEQQAEREAAKTPLPSSGDAGSRGQPGSAGAPPQGLPGLGDLSKPRTPSLKEKLFDQEVIGKIAAKEKKKDSAITFDTSEFRYHTYMARLKDKIESVWQYPPDAAARGLQGDLRIRFTIKKNGMLGDIEIERGSGHLSLDNAALKALRDAQPYWPLPDEWGKDSFTISGNFYYRMYGSFIR
jgi:protein TonB